VSIFFRSFRPPMTGGLLDGNQIAHGEHPSPYACTIAQTLVRDLEAECQRTGRSLPPNSAAAGSQVLPDMNLNLAPEYGRAVTGFGTLRELVQNWRDRCLAIDEAAAVVRLDTDPSGNGARLFASLTATSCQGYILEWCGTDGVQCVQLTNYGTTLHPDILVLGHSEKGCKAAAGCFGEGMKVELNRLVAAATSAHILTGDAVWGFHHRPMAGSAKAQLVLTMESSPAPRCPHTSHLLRGVGLRPVDVAQFLFLQPLGKGDLRFRGDLLEILAGPSAAGNVYVQGIHVWSCPSLVGCGLNFVGPAAMYSSLGFGRDRNTLQLRPLIALIPGAAANCRHRDPRYPLLVLWLYNTLLSAPESDLRLLVSSLNQLTAANTADLDALADDCVGTFERLHGSKAYPTASETGSSAGAASGFQAIIVSEPLLILLQRSPRCVTLAGLRENFQHALAGLPDAGPHPLMAQLQALVDEWFGPVLSGDALLFKAFPTDNEEPVVLVTIDRRVRYAIDLTLLDPTDPGAPGPSPPGAEPRGYAALTSPTAFFSHLSFHSLSSLFVVLSIPLFFSSSLLFPCLRGTVYSLFTH